MFVLGAPEELEALVGLFGKLYVYTLDCATFYCAKRSLLSGDFTQNYGFCPFRPFRTFRIFEEILYGGSEVRDMSVVKYVIFGRFWREPRKIPL